MMSPLPSATTDLAVDSPDVEQQSLFVSAPQTPRQQTSPSPVSTGISAPECPAVETPTEGEQAPIQLVGGPTFQAAPKRWSLSAEEREMVSASISQTWTDQAMKCYMCAADCSNCDIPQGQYSFVCQMDKVVPVLLDSLGQPDPHRLKRIFPQGYPHDAY